MDFYKYDRNDPLVNLFQSCIKSFGLLHNLVTGNKIEFDNANYNNSSKKKTKNTVAKAQ